MWCVAAPHSLHLSIYAADHVAGDFGYQNLDDPLGEDVPFQQRYFQFSRRKQGTRGHSFVQFALVKKVPRKSIDTTRASFRQVAAEANGNDGVVIQDAKNAYLTTCDCNACVPVAA